jgi:SAM-dependent methyltransferase
MRATEHGRLSNWRDTAGVTPEQARELAARLELRAKAADEVSARDAYLELLAISAGERVLDVGCGSGAVTRAIARRIGESGRVVGFDASRALLDVAAEYAREAGLAGRIEWQAGDCRALPFGDATFDASLAATVLAHVPDPEPAIKGMVRVTRIGGRVGIFDFDGDCFLTQLNWDREWTSGANLSDIKVTLRESAADPIVDVPILKVTGGVYAKGSAVTGGEILQKVPGEWIQPFYWGRYDDNATGGIEIELASERLAVA